MPVCLLGGGFCSGFVKVLELLNMLALPDELQIFQPTWLFFFGFCFWHLSAVQIPFLFAQYHL